MAKQVTDETRYTQPRLPTGTKPVHYDLSLKPDFNQFRYSGTVVIEIEYSGQTPTKSVVLNSVDLEISSGSILETDIALTSVIYSKESEAATLEFQDNIPPKCKILLEFTGTLNDKLKGFYRSTFKVDGETAYVGATQFEPNDARRCFPCFDEPSMKSTFTVSITIDKHMSIAGKQYERTALSNMPEDSRSGSDLELVIKFQKTPIMSTYLLAFVVGPFECIETSNKGRAVRVYTTPGKKELGRFALDVATKSLTFYEDYFKIDYPLPKMDLVAVPDFAFGAMENWGLITYRETRLLADPNNTATRVRQYTALVIAHEIAHQWFGNLVTMEWWTHLWLNEGFATFMEYLCITSVFPDWDITWFIADAWLRASRLDALHNSHPIEVPVQQPSDIDAIFDEISYEKGATVIRMMYEYIGDAAFRTGMHEYLKKFAYSNAVTEDLWEALGAASGKPVRDIMCDWTSKRGYPRLNIELKAPDTCADISQRQFLADGSPVDQETSALWMVPINAISSANVEQVHEVRLMGVEKAEIKLSVDLVDGDGSWIKFNPGMMGLYRVRYPKEDLKKLSAAVVSKKLQPMDRLNIQDDLFAFCAAGEPGASTVDLLELLEGSYQDEDNYTVWLSIDANIDQIATMLSEQPPALKEKFSAYCRSLYEKIYAKLQWDARPGELNETMTRALVINRLVSAGHPGVIEEAKERFRQHTDGTRALAADLRAAVYKAIASYGDDRAFESLFEIHRDAELAEEKNRAASALASTKDATRLERVVKFAMSNEVKNQDKPLVLIPLGSSSPSVAFKLLQDRRDWFLENYESSFLLVRFIKTCLENFTSHERAHEVEQYFEANKFPGADRAVQQAVEMIQLNANWLARDAKALEAYLSSRQ